MRGGLSLSFALHVGVALVALGFLPSVTPPLAELPPAIPVDLVTISDETNVRAMEKSETPKEEVEPADPEPEPDRVAALPPAPEPVVEPAPEPMPVPEPEPEKKPEPKPEPKVEAPKPVPKPAPPKKKEPAFDADKIAALLNKLPPKEKSATPGEQAQRPAAEQTTQAAGAGTAMTATWQALINEQMKRCWLVQAGAMEAERQIVTLRIDLNPDGTLAKPPDIVNAAEVAAGGLSYQVAAERALRAVRTCQPIKQLPPEHYADWRQMDFVFDPRAMLGG